MKKRGLRKYFRNLKHQKLPEILDFSGAGQSWFDLYHLHVDDLGLGNRSWKARKQHLDTLFELAECVKGKLLDYHKNYQFWIEVDENDSREDAIYIHTPNPNEDNFPITLEFDEGIEVKNLLLLNYLQEKDYLMGMKKLINAEGRACTTYFLYQEGLGTRINIKSNSATN
ncbi:hypothetical protein [Pontibacter cellulosilyticus]|uniref:Uncharacterized protein n=1 Tax=Pontibacter cellulosilyticus TaxID=1720253 RepID=A0A923N857_9BACT|nr:hypothetical protein [Pontibacter cellulosilyticus]MBC5993964.1 hypothetical protein [Pontibacter cellulosilyticus]